MPGGRNSGAVYNLYKVKYKKHKKKAMSKIVKEPVAQFTVENGTMNHTGHSHTLANSQTFVKPEISLISLQSGKEQLKASRGSPYRRKENYREYKVCVREKNLQNVDDSDYLENQHDAKMNAQVLDPLSNDNSHMEVSNVSIPCSSYFTVASNISHDGIVSHPGKTSSQGSLQCLSSSYECLDEISKQQCIKTSSIQRYTQKTDNCFQTDQHAPMANVPKKVANWMSVTGSSLIGTSSQFHFTEKCKTECVNMCVLSDSKHVNAHKPMTDPKNNSGTLRIACDQMAVSVNNMKKGGKCNSINKVAKNISNDSNKWFYHKNGKESSLNSTFNTSKNEYLQSHGNNYSHQNNHLCTNWLRPQSPLVVYEEENKQNLEEMGLISDLMECNKHLDITSVCESAQMGTEFDLESTSSMCRIGDEIVSRLVTWTHNLPFYKAIPISLHSKLLTQKWHEILMLVTTAHRALTEDESLMSHHSFQSLYSCNKLKIELYLRGMTGGEEFLHTLKAKEIIGGLTKIMLNFIQLKLKSEEYACLQVLLLLSEGDGKTNDLLQNIQDQYTRALRYFTRHNGNTGTNRLTDLLLQLPEIKMLSSDLLKSKMIYIPIFLNS